MYVLLLELCEIKSVQIIIPFCVDVANKGLSVMLAHNSTKNNANFH